jgi:uncharacterized protein YcbX
LKALKDGTYSNMFVGISPEMALFHCKLKSPGSFVVLYHAPTPSLASPGPEISIELPFEPPQKHMERINITMHTISSYPAFRMPEEINEWFSNCFGYNVILAYMGDGLGIQMKDEKTDMWLDTIKPSIPCKLPWVTFSDGAAIHVTAEASLDDLHPRLEGERAVMEKFRPNIVVDGTTAWDEDFWGQLEITGAGIKIILTSNCARCMSINVDLEKGRMGDGASGALLKRMMRDRRIDPGKKWEPIFGRYGFPTNGGEIKVGDDVAVSVRNKEHGVWSKFCTVPFLESSGANN